MKTFKKTRSEIMSFGILYVILVIFVLVFTCCFAKASASDFNSRNEIKIPILDSFNKGKSRLTFIVYCDLVQETFLEVEFEGLLAEEKVEVVIYDFTGKVLHRNVYLAKPGQPIQEINLGSMVNSGIIIFRANSAQDSITKTVLFR